MADDRVITTSEEDMYMATLARALKDLEASTITPDQFWNRLNRTREHCASLQCWSHGLH